MSIALWFAAYNPGMGGNPFKRANPDHPILDPLAVRYSPYVFEPRPVEPEKLRSCLEAARWAASSFNEQPWSFLIAVREDAQPFQRMVGCLVESNQQWARHAGVLMITVVKRAFSRNDKPNRVAEHDVGLAVGNLTMQALSLGLLVHEMGGIDLAQCRRVYAIPEGFDPLTGLALGYAGDPAQAPSEELAQRDRAPRSRRPLAQFVFTERWQQPSPYLG